MDSLGNLEDAQPHVNEFASSASNANAGNSASGRQAMSGPEGNLRRLCGKRIAFVVSPTVVLRGTGKAVVDDTLGPALRIVLDDGTATGNAELLLPESDCQLRIASGEEFGTDFSVYP